MPEDVTHAEVIRRIRNVVEERRRVGSFVPPPQVPPFAATSAPIESWEVYPWRRPKRPSVPGSPRLIDAVALIDLIGLDVSRFLQRAYQALIGREPHSDELSRWTGRLDRRWPRTAVVLALRYSKEGRTRAVRIHGLGRIASEFARATLARLRLGGGG